MINQPFSPHPNWRNNFAFTPAHPTVTPQYKLDPVIQTVQDAKFTLDPIIHKFNVQLHT